MFCFVFNSITGYLLSQTAPSGTLTWTCVTTGRITKQTLPSGAYTTYAYDDENRLSAMENYAPDGTSLSVFTNIQYDDAGRRLSYDAAFAGHPTWTGTRSFTDDPLTGRLTGETFTPLNLDNTYSYDAAGNHLGTFHGETLTAADYDRNNQRTGTGFVYTAEGDPTMYAGTPLAYDAEHYLTRYGDAQTPTLTAAYGPTGLRAWKEANGAHTLFYYDGEQLIGQQTGEDAVIPIVTGAVGLISFGDTFYFCDPDGNVIQRLDDQGVLQSTTLYDAWGQPLAGDSPADPFGYKGQVGYYTDLETGLILCTHRYYDPERGAWLTRDPIGYEGGENLFEYCGGEPVNRVDPDGKNPLLVSAAIGAIIGGTVHATIAYIGGERDSKKLLLAFGKGAFVGAVVGFTGGIGGLAGEALAGAGGLSAAASATLGGALSGGASDAAFQLLGMAFGMQSSYNGWQTLEAVGIGGLTAGICASIPTWRLRAIVSRAARRVDSEGMNAYTMRQANAIYRDPRALPRFRGLVIDRIAREHVRQDWVMRLVRPVRGRCNMGPDFIDPITGRWWDMTTPRQWQAHVIKYTPGCGRNGTFLSTLY